MLTQIEKYPPTYQPLFPNFKWDFVFIQFVEEFI